MTDDTVNTHTYISNHKTGISKLVRRKKRQKKRLHEKNRCVDLIKKGRS